MSDALVASSNGFLPTVLNDRAGKVIAALSSIEPADLEHLDVVIAEVESALATLVAFRKVAGRAVKVRSRRGHVSQPPEAPAAVILPITISMPDLPAPPEARPQEDKPKPKKSKDGTHPRKAFGADEKAKKFDFYRKQCVEHIARVGRSVRSGELIIAVKISPRWINEILDHAWFSQSAQGIHITPKARQEVLES